MTIWDFKPKGDLLTTVAVAPLWSPCPLSSRWHGLLPDLC